MSYLKYCRRVVEEYGIKNAYSSSQQKWMIDATAKELNMPVDDVLLKSIGFSTEEDLANLSKDILNGADGLKLIDYVGKLFWEGLDTYSLETSSHLKELLVRNQEAYKSALVDFFNEHVMYCDDIELGVFCSDCNMYINDSVDIDNLFGSVYNLGYGKTLCGSIVNNYINSKSIQYNNYVTMSPSEHTVRMVNSLLYNLDTKFVEVSSNLFSVDKYLDSGHIICQIDTDYSVLIPFIDYDAPVKYLIIPTKSLSVLYASCKLQSIRYVLNDKSNMYVAVFEDGSSAEKYLKSL